MVRISKWKQINNEYFDDVERCVTIDAWKTGNPNEQGKIIAKVYEDKEKGTVYIDKKAESDEYAQEAIRETQELFGSNPNIYKY